MKAENQLGLAQPILSERTCSGDVSPNTQTSENPGPSRTLPSEIQPTSSHELLSHRTLSRGPGGQFSETLSRGPTGQFSETLSRGLAPGGQLSEHRTLQLGPRQRLIIGADTIVREREVGRMEIASSLDNLA